MAPRVHVALDSVNAQRQQGDGVTRDTRLSCVMKKCRPLDGEAGVSLLEVLVTALVVAVAIVGLTIMLSRGQAAVVQQGDTRVALQLAQQKIERLRALGFSAAKVGTN